MPSGSSGTLLKKESKKIGMLIFIVIEMDEVNSSSSSSIGREKQGLYDYNFTGKPFAPDNIFDMNRRKNLGEDDEGEEFEHVQEISPI